MPTILNPNLSRFQWAVLLLVYMVTPPTWAAPTASFTTFVNPGGPPYSVFLNAISSSPWEGNNAITNLEWSDSKNGNIIQQITTATSFSSAGTYSITLTVWDAAGNSDTLTKSVTVGKNGSTSPPPTNGDSSTPDILPIPSFKIEEINGFTVKVDASASSSGNNSSSITKYEYEAVSYGQFGIDSSKSYTSTTPKTSITFNKAGSYTISLHVTNSNGKRSTTPAQQNVNVKPLEITANFITGVIDGCRVSVNASASTPTNQIVRYEYSWRQSGSTESGNVTRYTDYSDITLPQSGTYNISLKVFNASGNSSINTSNQNVTIGTSCASTEDSTQLNQGSSFGNLIYGDPNTTVTNDDFTIMVTASIGSDINAFEPLTLEAISAEGFVVGNDNSVDINATIVPSPEHENVYIVIVIGWDDQEGLTDWGKVKWYYKVLPKDILNDGWKRFTPELSDLSNLSIPQYIMARSGEQSHSVNVFTGQLLPPEIEDFGTARRVHFVVGYTPNNDLYLLSQPITLKVPVPLTPSN